MSAPNSIQTFLNEAEDLLSRIEAIALELSPGQPVGEEIHQLFRAFHTLKGSGAMFGFDAIAGFTHHIETALDKVREGVAPVSEELIELILRSQDHIKALLAAAQDETPAPISAGDEIIAALKALVPETADAAANRANVIQQTAKTVNAGAAEQSFRIRFRPHPALMASGTDPVALLNELRGLGECRVSVIADAVPGLELLQPDNCYLAWDIELKTTRGFDAIKDVFIFVEDGSELEITAIESASQDHGASESGAGVSACGFEHRPGATSADSGSETLPKPAAVTAGPQNNSPSAARARKPASEGSVRVPSERLDRLVNLVGELVMNQSRLTQVAQRASVPNLAAPVEELERLVAELRDTVLGIRMMPIGTTFGRFKRLVHDLSRELGKEIELITGGEETELDKTVLDQLGDPLVHLIRNSIDHGLEAPDERERLGKPRCGAVRLIAAHEGAHVIVTIQDDGRGLDRAAIRSKAVEKGLVTAEAQLSDEEIFGLIFLPGFSTAREVSNVSGRGVGMDAAKRTIESLRGSISVASAPGQGTTVRLTLPLTLAIIDGLLVETGGERLIIALSAVMENVELTRAERQSNNGRNVVAVRGELIPYIRLRDLFEIRGAEPDIEKVVIVSLEQQRLGLVVDRVIGSHQTVIQPLGRFCRGIELFSGTTIMGDGRVAMILDLAGVARGAERGSSAAAGATRKRFDSTNQNQTNMKALT